MPFSFYVFSFVHFSTCFCFTLTFFSLRCQMSEVKTLWGTKVWTLQLLQHSALINRCSELAIHSLEVLTYLYWQLFAWYKDPYIRNMCCRFRNDANRRNTNVPKTHADGKHLHQLFKKCTTFTKSCIYKTLQIKTNPVALKSWPTVS